MRQVAEHDLDRRRGLLEATGGRQRGLRPLDSPGISSMRAMTSPRTVLHAVADVLNTRAAARLGDDLDALERPPHPAWDATAVEVAVG